MTEDINKGLESQQLPKPNPALEALGIFVGDWEMEVSRASFLPDPSDTIKGSVTIEWLEDGAFLIIRQGDKSNPPFSVWLIGRDDSTETYKMLYFDGRGVSRVYDMSFKDGLWKIWREAPGFHQRFKGTFSQDGKRISAEWENSTDGDSWEHDFDLMYTKTDSIGKNQKVGNDLESDLPKLAAPARRALAGAGFVRLEQLTEATEAQILELHGMGPNAMQTLRQAMAEKGLSFADSTGA